MQSPLERFCYNLTITLMFILSGAAGCAFTDPYNVGTTEKARVSFAYLARERPPDGSLYYSGLPTPADNFDVASDADIYFLIGITKPKETMIVRLEWIDPDGKLYHMHKRQVTPCARRCGWKWNVAKIFTGAVADHPGQWRVDAFLKDAQVGSYSFTLKSVGNKPHIYNNGTKSRLVNFGFFGKGTPPSGNIEFKDLPRPIQEVDAHEEPEIYFSVGVRRPISHFRIIWIDPKGRPYKTSERRIKWCRLCSWAFRGSRLVNNLGREGSGRTDKQEPFTQHDILHFATHTDLKETDPMSSALLLAPEGNEDGRLEVSEVFGMNLNADLVVVSGCETA